MTREIFANLDRAAGNSARVALFNIVGASPASISLAPSAQRDVAVSYVGVWIFALLVLLVAWLAQCALHGVVAPLVTGGCYFLLSLVLVRVASRSHDAIAAFALSFALCNATAAAVLWYSLQWFNTPTSTLDANSFLGLITNPISTDLDAMKGVVNSPLPVLIWQILFAAWGKLGLAGIWVGVQFNALLVGLCAALTQTVARLALGDHPRLLRYGVWLGALCGLNLLFGAILIRDSFALLLNVLALYGLARFLAKPHASTYMLALLLNTVAAFGMYYVREKSIYLFPVFVLLASCMHLLSDRMTPIRIGLALFALLVVVAGFGHLSGLVEDAVQASDQKASAYAQGAEVSSRRDSLGVALIVKQPEPIKAVAGSVYLFVQPVPLWGFFDTSLVEYLWVKGYQGLYAAVIFPSLICGGLLFLQRDRQQSTRTTLRRFLVAYLIFTTMLVALTSMETRHHGQFYPAYLILAMAAWRPHRAVERARLVAIRWGWLLVIVAGHAAWWLLR